MKGQGEDDIIIPDGVKSIETWAFSECSYKCIKLPKSVKKIASFALSSKSKSREVYITGETQSIESDYLGGNSNKDTTVHTPAGSRAEAITQKYYSDVKIVNDYDG